jgi:branched-chain amino acid transport system ATP-binding protein
VSDNLTPVLEVHGLTVSYGGVHANFDIGLQVLPGQCVGLIGPNGAGKTTALDAITGFVATDAGTVQFRGKEISQLRPDQRAREGLVRTFQGGELFDDLTVADNLLVSSEDVDLQSVLRDVSGISPAHNGLDQVERALDVFELQHTKERLVRDLPEGSRKLVGIARALARTPSVLLLDEPAAGLDTHETNDLSHRLHSLRKQGIGVLIVDHDMGLISSICDFVYVLNFGKVIASGTPDEVVVDPMVVSAYLGESAGAAQRRHHDPLDVVRKNVVESRSSLEGGT